jgi:hypothetical protein
MRVCNERCKQRAGPRHTILPLPPHYHVRGERAALVSGRKRPITALDETPAFSSVSDGSASTDSSRPPRFRRSTKLEQKDEWVSSRHTAVGGPAMPATEGDRGGGFAPAHRRKLDVAHSNNNQTLSKVIASARQRNASSGNTAGSRPSMPTHKGEVGVDLHLRQATTLTLRLATTTTNPHLTDTLRRIMNL